jgi:ParB/RepB/Spo0J family partition protein
MATVTNIRGTRAAVIEYPRVSIEQIRAGAQNPRQNFDKEELKELAASIREHGVLEPLLLRHVPLDASSTRYEVVAGERRWRAARSLGLKDVPAIVRQLSDQEAAVVACVENLHRKDLDPCEEAAGFGRLLNDHRMTLADIAAKVGKSRSHVAQRLVLLRLPEEATKAVRDGRFSAGVALLVARIPDPKLRRDATQELLRLQQTPVRLSDAAHVIRDKYTRLLARAPFPVNDAALVAAAGSCTDCPKRSGNDRTLFGDIEGNDVCTDSACFTGKVEAHWQREKAQAAAKGYDVAEGKPAQRLVASGYVQPGAVDLAERCEADPKRRTWKALLGKQSPRPTLVRDPHTGAAHVVVEEKAAREVLAKAGHTWAKPVRDTGDASRKEQILRKRKALLLRRTQGVAMAALVGKVERQQPDAGFWRLFVDAIRQGSWHETIAAAVTRRGWATKGTHPSEALKREAEKLTGDQLRALGLELLLGRGGHPSWGVLAFPKLLTKACAHYAIPLKKLHAETIKVAAQKRAARRAEKGGGALKK